MRSAYLFSLALAFAQLAAAAPWNLATCSPDQAAAHTAFEQRVRSAKPDSLLYLPHPYPQTRAETVADFAQQFRAIWSDEEPAEVPADEQRVLTALADGRLGVELARVENWSLTRCGDKQRRAYYHLLRLFDPETGAELGRAALNDTGLLAKWTLFSMDAEEAREQMARLRFSRLPEAAERIRGAFGLPVQGAQYVHSTGAIRCELLSPCVAFKSGGRSYLYGPVLEPQGLYRLEEGRPRLSFRRDLATPAKKAAVERTLNVGQKVVSLGGDSFTVATRVEPTR